MTEEWRDETMADAEGTDPAVAAAAPQVVVVAVDFSLPARRALAWAIEYAQHISCVLHTVHVVDRRFQASDLAADPGAIRTELTNAEQLAAAELKALNDDGRARLGMIHEHVAFGKPADEVLRVARELGAILIVIGSHGRDAISHLLLGSVAERVVRGADCPVAVIKHK